MKPLSERRGDRRAEPRAVGKTPTADACRDERVADRVTRKPAACKLMVLVSLREDRFLRGWTASGKAHAAGCVLVAGDAADCDFQLFEQLVNRGFVREIAAGKAAMDLGLLFVFGRKEGSEIGFVVDRDGVVLPQLKGAVEQVLLHFAENCRNRGNEF